MLDDNEIRKTFVMPFYMACGNPDKYDTLIDALNIVYNKFDDEIIEFLYTGPHGWREYQVASWICGLRKDKKWHTTISKLLLESRVCFAGRIHCYYMLRIGDVGSRNILVDYLNIWLRRLDCDYDQGCAYAVYMILNERLGLSDENIDDLFAKFRSEKSFIPDIDNTKGLYLKLDRRSNEIMSQLTSR